MGGNILINTINTTQYQPQVVKYNYKVNSQNATSDDLVVKKHNDFKQYINKYNNQLFTNDNIAYNLKRGSIEIKRFFKDDKFAIRLFLVNNVNDLNKWNKDTNNKFNFSLTINNKAYPQANVVAVTKHKIFENNEYTKNYFGSWLTFNENYNEYKNTFLGKSKYLQFTEVLLLPEMLNIKYSDLENITVAFKGETNTNHVNYVQFQKRNSDSNIGDINSNSTTIALNDYNCYLFDELNSEIITNIKGFRNINVLLNNFDQFRPNSNLGKITTDYWASANYTPWIPGKSQQNSTYDFYNIYEFLEDPFAQAVKSSIRLMSLESQLPSFGIDSFNNKHYKKVENNVLNVRTNDNISVKESYDKTLLYNHFMEYDYLNQEVINSYTGSEHGLIIPYNFSGNWNTEYNFFIDLYDKNKKANYLNFKITNTTKIERPLLNIDNGIIKLYVDYNDELKEDHKYKFNLKNIEEILNIKNDIDALGRYLA